MARPLWPDSCQFHLLLNINELRVIESTGTEGAKCPVYKSGKPGAGVTSERRFRNYLGRDEDYIAFKRSANLEAWSGHRLHIAGVARARASFFTDRALD